MGPRTAAGHLPLEPGEIAFAVDSHNSTPSEYRKRVVFTTPPADGFRVDTDKLSGLLDRYEERRRYVVGRRSMGAHQKRAPESAFGNVNPPQRGPEGPPI